MLSLFQFYISTIITIDVFCGIFCYSISILYKYDYNVEQQFDLYGTLLFQFYISTIITIIIQI